MRFHDTLYNKDKLRCSSDILTNSNQYIYTYYGIVLLKYITWTSEKNN